MKCETCRGQRWQMVHPKWSKANVLESEWRPFDRFNFSVLGAALVSTMLATKVLRPCPSCNPERRAPWAQEFKDDGSPASEPSGAKPF